MIVAAVDFSSHDHDTLACATSMAGLMGEPVLLVHIVGQGNDRADVYGDSAERLSALADEVDVDVFPETLDADRDVVRSLTALAERLSPRLMVVGGQNGGVYHGVQHAASRLSRRLACPLLVAGNTGALATRRYSERPLRVLVPCDMTHDIDGALRIVRELRSTTALDCELVNYYWPPSETHRAGEMRALIAEDGWSCRAEATPETVGRAVAGEARERSYDLVVLATRRRGSLGRLLHPSVRETLLKETSVPLLLAPTRNRAQAHTART